MSSTNKTSLGLNNWAASDKPVREDFNKDNTIINDSIAKLNSDLTAVTNFKWAKHTSNYGIDVETIEIGTTGIKAFKIAGYLTSALASGTEYTLATIPGAASKINWFHNILVSGNSWSAAAYFRIDTSGTISIRPHAAISSGMAINLMEFYV